jgi:hypothetical protein
MKIRPVGAELLHADGRTGMTKLNSCFSQFANAPKKPNKDNDKQRGWKKKRKNWTKDNARDKIMPVLN